MKHIKLFRIDYRLLHWQTGTMWAQKLGINTIVIASDEVAGDPVKTKLILFAAPKTLETKLLSVSQAIDYLNDVASRERSIELLVDSTDVALAIVRGVEGIQSINAALMKQTVGKEMLTKYISVDEKDRANFRELLEMGIKVQCFTTVTDTVTDIRKYL